MMMQRGGGGRLEFPFGVRFRPTDAELIEFYLRPRLQAGISPASFLIQEADIYKRQPSDLFADVGQFFIYGRHEIKEMYFFTPRHPAGGGGKMVSRTVAGGSGTWDGRAAGILIMSAAGDEIIGHKMQFCFNQLTDDENGRRKKIKKDWLMHEYRLHSPDSDKFDDFVLCRIYKKKEKGRGDEERGNVNVDEEQAERLVKRQRIVAAAGGSSSSSDSHMMLQLQEDYRHNQETTLLAPSSSSSASAAAAAAAASSTPTPAEDTDCNDEDNIAVYRSMLEDAENYIFDVESGSIEWGDCALNFKQSGVVQFPL